MCDLYKKDALYVVAYDILILQLFNSLVKKAEYIKIKGEMKELDVGRVFRKIVKQYIVKCCVIDSELYQVYLNELKRLAKEDDVIIDVIARRRFGKEPVEEVAVPGVIKVYQDRFYMENQWNICVKATVIVE